MASTLGTPAAYSIACDTVSPPASKIRRRASYLGTWKIMTLGDGRRVFVQYGLAISSSVVREMGKGQKSRFLRLMVGLRVGGSHDGRRNRMQETRGYTEDRQRLYGTRSSSGYLYVLFSANATCKSEMMPLTRC